VNVILGEGQALPPCSGVVNVATEQHFTSDIVEAGAEGTPKQAHDGQFNWIEQSTGGTTEVHDTY
jgi:hypothetical protein